MGHVCSKNFKKYKEKKTQNVLSKNDNESDSFKLRNFELTRKYEKEFGLNQNIIQTTFIEVYIEKELENVE